MTREIKFRGLGVDGKWWYGETKPEGENHINLAAFFANLHAGVIRPETVGEYTGLHDKNGREIYEGDIVTHQPNEHAGLHKVAVTWLDHSACFWPLGAIEVIGNIYEGGQEG